MPPERDRIADGVTFPKRYPRPHHALEHSLSQKGEMPSACVDRSVSQHYEDVDSTVRN